MMNTTSGMLQNHAAEAIILDGEFLSYSEFGDAREKNEIINLETQIKQRLNESVEVDGHEFGESTYTIYLYCESADQAFEKIKDILRKSYFDRFEVTLQYGPPEDLKTKEKHFTFS